MKINNISNEFGKLSNQTHNNNLISTHPLLFWSLVILKQIIINVKFFFMSIDKQTNHLLGLLHSS